MNAESQTMLNELLSYLYGSFLITYVLCIIGAIIKEILYSNNSKRAIPIKRIIFGTIYIMYLVYLGVRLNKIAKENVEIKILFIFMVANIMKLMLSKTFIYDSSIWIYISLGNLIITKYARARRAFQNEKMYQENTSKIQE